MSKFIKYTSNGYSVSLLKAKAKDMQKKLGITKKKSLNSVAQECGFLSWDKLLKDVVGYNGCLFFNDVYSCIKQEISIIDDGYKDYLATNQLLDSQDNCRSYTSLMHATFMKAGGDNMKYEYLWQDFDKLLKEVSDTFAIKGNEYFLPHNMTSSHLEGLIQCGDLYFEMGGEGNFQPLLFCIIRLGYPSIELGITKDEAKNFFDNHCQDIDKYLKTYYFNLLCELYVRQRVIEPRIHTLETILSDNQELQINATQDLYEKIR